MVNEAQFTNKNILLGVTGGIAAYKAASLLRLLKKRGANVRVVMTKAAEAFITPLTLQTLSGNPVKTDCWSLAGEAEIDHIELARWADLLLVAPASANCLAKLANGIADDLLCTLYLATTAPVAVAPAMNQQMWAHQATQRNVQQLQQDGVLLWGPASGEQACGEVGPGRMVEPEELVAQVAEFWQTNMPTPLIGRKVLITAGPTHEPLDPVRYLSNHSSGKMGFAIAEALVEAGAQVTLVAGPVNLSPPRDVTFRQVTSAREMYDAVMTELPGQDIFIGTAAVADYTPVAAREQKIKKDTTTDHWQLDLVKTPDILAEVAASDTTLGLPPFTVGFAAETEQLIAHAQAKRQRKKVDLLCANWVGKPGIGFAAEDNELTILSDAAPIHLTKAPKRQLAKRLVAIIAEKFHAKRASKNTQ